MAPLSTRDMVQSSIAEISVTDSDERVAKAAQTLAVCCTISEQHRKEALAAAAVPTLLSCIQHSTNLEVLRACCWALKELGTQDLDAQAEICTSSGAACLVAVLSHVNLVDSPADAISLVLHLLELITNMARASNAQLRTLEHSGAVPVLLSLFGTCSSGMETQALQLPLATALHELASSGSGGSLGEMERTGAAPLLLAPLTPHVEHKLQPLLVNLLLLMATHSDTSCEAIRAAAGIPRILRLLGQPAGDSTTQMAAALLLKMSKASGAVLKQLLEDGGVLPLLACLSTAAAHEPVCIHAARILQALSQLDLGCEEIAANNGVALLCEVAYADPEGPGTAACLQALNAMAGYTNLRSRFSSAGAVKALLPLLDPETASPQDNFDTVLRIMVALSEEPTNRAAIVRDGAVVVLLNTMRKPPYRGAVLLCLTTVTQCITAQSSASVVLSNGGHNAMAQLLSSPEGQQKGQLSLTCLRGLTNLAVHMGEDKEPLRQCGGLSLMLQYIVKEPSGTALQLEAIKGLAAACTHSSVGEDVLQAGALTTVSRMLMGTIGQPGKLSEQGPDGASYHTASMLNNLARHASLHTQMVKVGTLGVSATLVQWCLKEEALKEQASTKGTISDSNSNSNSKPEGLVLLDSVGLMCCQLICNIAADASCKASVFASCTDSLVALLLFTSNRKLLDRQQGAPTCACLTLSSMARDTPSCSKICSTGVVVSLTRKLHGTASYSPLVKVALNTLKVLVTGSPDSITQAEVTALLPALRHLLSLPSDPESQSALSAILWPMLMSLKIDPVAFHKQAEAASKQPLPPIPSAFAPSTPPRVPPSPVLGPSTPTVADRSVSMRADGGRRSEEGSLLLKEVRTKYDAGQLDLALATSKQRIADEYVSRLKSDLSDSKSTVVDLLTQLRNVETELHTFQTNYEAEKAAYRASVDAEMDACRTASAAKVHAINASLEVSITDRDALLQQIAAGASRWKEIEADIRREAVRWAVEEAEVERKILQDRVQWVLAGQEAMEAQVLELQTQVSQEEVLRESVANEIKKAAVQWASDLADAQRQAKEAKETGAIAELNAQEARLALATAESVAKSTHVECAVLRERLDDLQYGSADMAADVTKATALLRCELEDALLECSELRRRLEEADTYSNQVNVKLVEARQKLREAVEEGSVVQKKLLEADEASSVMQRDLEEAKQKLIEADRSDLEHALEVSMRAEKTLSAQLYEQNLQVVHLGMKWHELTDQVEQEQKRLVDLKGKHAAEVSEVVKRVGAVEAVAEDKLRQANDKHAVEVAEVEALLTKFEQQLSSLSSYNSKMEEKMGQQTTEIAQLTYSNHQLMMNQQHMQMQSHAQHQQTMQLQKELSAAALKAGTQHDSIDSYGSGMGEKQHCSMESYESGMWVEESLESTQVPIMDEERQRILAEFSHLCDETSSDEEDGDDDNYDNHDNYDDNNSSDSAHDTALFTLNPKLSLLFASQGGQHRSGPPADSGTRSGLQPTCSLCLPMRQSMSRMSAISGPKMASKRKPTRMQQLGRAVLLPLNGILYVLVRKPIRALKQMQVILPTQLPSALPPPHTTDESKTSSLEQRAAEGTEHLKDPLGSIPNPMLLIQGSVIFRNNSIGSTDGDSADDLDFPIMQHGGASAPRFPPHLRSATLLRSRYSDTFGSGALGSSSDAWCTPTVSFEQWTSHPSQGSAHARANSDGQGQAAVGREAVVIAVGSPGGGSQLDEGEDGELIFWED